MCTWCAYGVLRGCDLQFVTVCKVIYSNIAGASDAWRAEEPGLPGWKKEEPKPEPKEKRKRGRPVGSKNKNTLEREAALMQNLIKLGPGRPQRS